VNEPVKVVAERGVVQARLDAAAVGREDDRVLVDRAAVGRPQLGAHGQLVERRGEAELAEHAQHRLQLGRVDGQVEVGVRAGLAADRGVDRPAAGDPGPQAAGVEGAQERHDLLPDVTRATTFLAPAWD
jgi:hypothetical protein